MAFIRATGTRFTLNGETFIPYGGTTYPAGGANWTNSFVDNTFSKAIANGFTSLRFINFLQSDIYNEPRWATVDRGLNIARQNGMKIIMDLSDISNRITSTGHALGTQAGYDDWNAFLDFYLPRVNTVNGQVYKDDDTIGWITFSGEPNASYNSVLVDHYGTITGYLKSKGASQLVGPGGMEDYNPWAEVMALPTVDFVPSHPYSYQSVPGQITTRIEFFRTTSQQYQKPWFIEEVGAVQRFGDQYRSTIFNSIYKLAHKNGCAGFIFWNFSDEVLGQSYDVNAGTPLTLKMIKTFSKIKAYSPRITVEAAQFGGM